MNNSVVAQKRNWLFRRLNWISLILLAAMLLFHQWLDLLSVPAIICAGAAMIRIACPGYFAVLGEKKYQNQGRIPLSAVPWLAFSPLGFAIWQGINRTQYFEIVKPLLITLIAGLAMGILFIVFAKTLRRNAESVFLALVLSVFLCAGIVIQGNHLLAREPFVFEQVPIVNMYRWGEGKSTEYNCILQFPDGRELTVDVGRIDFEQFKVGDILTIPVRTGAFGIEYGLYGYEG